MSLTRKVPRSIIVLCFVVPLYVFFYRDILSFYSFTHLALSCVLFLFQIGLFGATAVYTVYKVITKLVLREPLSIGYLALACVAIACITYFQPLSYAKEWITFALYQTEFDRIAQAHMAASCPENVPSCFVDITETGNGSVVQSTSLWRAYFNDDLQYERILLMPGRSSATFVHFYDYVPPTGTTFRINSAPIACSVQLSDTWFICTTFST